MPAGERGGGPGVTGAFRDNRAAICVCALPATKWLMPKEGCLHTLLEGCLHTLLEGCLHTFLSSAEMEINMNLIHRNIDFEKDKDYILERHCRINYACESPWKREMTYLDYRSEWFSLAGQITGFYEYLRRTAQDDRAIAEIIETEDGRIVGYLWATFCEDEESGFRFAEIEEIYIEEEFRRHGVAAQLYEYAEAKARRNHAKVIRSGTGICNSASIQLHERLGFVPYRYEFEKLLLNKIEMI